MKDLGSDSAVAGDGDISIVHFSKALHQGQTQPDPSLRSIKRLRSLHEQLENMRHFLGSNALSIVANTNPLYESS